MYDSEGMTCQQCREVVSASLDGEGGATERSIADAHLAGCAACRAYEVDARRVARLIRVRPAEHVPDVAGPLLASLGIAERESQRVAAADPAAPGLTCLPGGCCGGGPVEKSAEVRAAGPACGCLATCGCGCQDGAPCRCGVRAA